MNDLLNEKDFSASQYNPWPLFRRFYLFAIAQIAVVQLCVSFILSVSGILMFVVYLLLPAVTVVWMFTSNTKNFLLERRIKIIAIVWLMLSFTITNLIVNIAKIVFRPTMYVFLDLWQQLLVSILFFIIQLGVCFLVVSVVSGVVKNKLQN